MVYHPDPLRPPLPQDWGFATPQIQSLYQERVKIYGLQIWLVHSQGLSEQKPIQNFGEKGVWVYPGPSQIPPLKISGKVAVGVLTTQGLSKIFRAPYNKYGASRGHLCDSSAVLYIFLQFRTVTNKLTPNIIND